MRVEFVMTGTFDYKISYTTLFSPTGSKRTPRIDDNSEFTSLFLTTHIVAYPCL